jgi:transcriptional regulator with XRE-family HTH domain
MTKHVIESSAESFGERLARLRKAAGYTQKELGDEVGTSQRMVAYYEAQTQHPPTKLMPALARALGVSADELLGLASSKARRKTPDSRLDRRLRAVQDLPAVEKRQVLAFIDALLDRERLKRRAG